MRKKLPEQPKILVLTLYSGENELEDSIHSLNKQTYKNWQRIIFKNLPNVKAHQKLYSAIMAKKNEYDLFIKLDGDMVFKHSLCLENIISLFKNHPKMDHAETVVHDWYSDTMISGMHIFTANVVWERNRDKIFVDHKPRILGFHRHVADQGAPFVSHSPNPSEFQAYAFGIHRGLKAVQWGNKKKNPKQCHFQWALMENVWENYCKTKDKRLGYALLGFDDIIGKRAVHLIKKGYKDANLKEYFIKKYYKKRNEDVYRLLEGNWANNFARKIRMFTYKKILFFF